MGSRACYNEEDSAAGRNLKIVLEDIMYERGLKPQDCAAKINISSERLYKYLNKNNTYNNLPAYLIPIWHRMVGPDLLKYLAHEAGCVIIDAPRESDDIMDAVESATSAMKECSEALHAFSTAVADGRVSYREYKDIVREVTEAMSALLGLQLTAERMRDGKRKGA